MTRVIEVAVFAVGVALGFGGCEMVPPISEVKVERWEKANPTRPPAWAAIGVCALGWGLVAGLILSGADESRRAGGTTQAEDD